MSQLKNTHAAGALSSINREEKSGELVHQEEKLKAEASADPAEGVELACVTDGHSSVSLSLPTMAASNLPEHLSENVHATSGEQVIDFSMSDQTEVNEVTSTQASNMVLSKDTTVMYMNPDGTLVFDGAQISSDDPEKLPIVLESGSDSVISVSASETSVNSNYLVVVENSDMYQMLSTSAHRNLVLSSGHDIPVSSEIPQTHDISFNTAGNGGERSNFDMDVTNYPAQTITMVLDKASHIGQKGILVEPNSFVTYSDQKTLTTDNLTFHTVQSVKNEVESSASLPTHSLYEASDGALIDISSLNIVASETPSSITVHHKPSAQPTGSDAQERQTVWMEGDHGLVKTFHHKTLHPTSQETITSNVFEASSSGTQIVSGELAVSFNRSRGQALGNEPIEESNAERKKQELRFLEQSHLAHHMRQLKIKQNETESLGQENCETFENVVDSQVEESLSTEEIESLEKIGINDETPIFTSITAKLNSNLLTHVPGCQQFLLEKVQQNSSLVCDITFDSDQSCTFSGGLRALICIHNLLKTLVKSRTKTLLDVKVERNGKATADESVMCDLLKPYVSMRGRQPKCSLKVAEMGFFTDIDSYLNTDATHDKVDTEYTATASRSENNGVKGKRKRGRPSRVVKRKGRKVKLNYAPSVLDSQNYGTHQDEKRLISAEIQSEWQDMSSLHETNVTDGLQQRLLEEQRKYREIACRKRRQSVRDLSEVVSGPSSASAALSQTSVESEATDKFHVLAESGEKFKTTSTVDMDAISRQKRGRPRKVYDPLCTLEKVQPRNPLTESPATKLQRNYEEQVSFKFFCTQCSFKTKRQSHFISHLRCHKDGTEKKYTCSKCDFVTISIPTLKRHELRHKDNLFSCKLCAAYTTDRITLLRRHVRLKHNVVCVEQKEMSRGKPVKPRVELDRASDEPGDEAFSCTECKRSFRSRMHLQRHIRDVHGPDVRPHLCDTCGKAFKRTDALQQHKLVHLSRTARSLPFKCTSCGKGFRSPAHLKEHMSMHSSERPYLCQYCGAAFKTQPVQKKHIMTLHIRPRTHVCSVCSRQFNTKHALQRHEHTHVKTDSVTETAVLIIERENAVTEQKHSTLTHVNDQSGSLSVEESSTIGVEGQINSCLGQDMIGTAAATTSIEEPLEQTGQGLQQAYIQGTQDGTLYYFTGEMPTL